MEDCNPSLPSDLTQGVARRPASKRMATICHLYTNDGAAILTLGEVHFRTLPVLRRLVPVPS
jgi:hypothetical protein